MSELNEIFAKYDRETIVQRDFVFDNKKSFWSARMIESPTNTSAIANGMARIDKFVNRLDRFGDFLKANHRSQKNGEIITPKIIIELLSVKNNKELSTI